MKSDPPKEKHDHLPLSFPEGFLWGAATSAHQVEGKNASSDWWAWEQNLPADRQSGVADDQYNLYESDFDLAKSLGHNAHRLSIEWARIEPKEGFFDPEAIEHYKKVLKALKDRGLTVMLTLHHFTNPKWIADKGGWENGQTVKYFERFVKKIVPEIKDYVDLWVTINEPGVYSFCSYLIGKWPPQKKSQFLSFKVLWIMARAHKKAYKAIHEIIPNSMVGIANNVQSYHAYHKHSFIEQMAVLLGDGITNHLFYTMTQGCHDFLGVNYYFHHRLRKAEQMLPRVEEVDRLNLDVSDLGWEIFPEGIYDVLTDLADHIPIYITECGIASTNDDRRCRFLISYLQATFHAINSGVNVKGFFVWSLLDNFEWADGFNPRFGIIEVDYETQRRIPRPSAYVYEAIARENAIPHHLLRFIGHTVKAEEVLCFKHDGPKALCEHLK